MNMKDALLCLDCDEIFTGECCPVCLNRISVYVSEYLGSMGENNHGKSDSKVEDEVQSEIRGNLEAVESSVGKVLL